MKRLKLKKAIVTGANRSIGRAIALAFAREGADVVISYRTDEKGSQETVKEIEALGQRSLAIHADFTTVAGVEGFFKQAVDFLGTVDVLVNNAGGYNTTDFLHLDTHDLEYLLQVGVTAPMLLTQLVAKQMIAQGIPGKIINVSSISGSRPYPNRTAHSTAKAALNMLTQSMALELAQHHIRVNAIAPGYTPYLNEIPDPRFLADIPLGRAGTPEDQAAAVVFLASDASSWMTGQILTIDGGQSLSQ